MFQACAKPIGNIENYVNARHYTEVLDKRKFCLTSQARVTETFQNNQK